MHHVYPPEVLYKDGLMQEQRARLTMPVVQDLLCGHLCSFHDHWQGALLFALGACSRPNPPQCCTQSVVNVTVGKCQILLALSVKMFCPLTLYQKPLCGLFCIANFDELAFCLLEQNCACGAVCRYSCIFPP